MVMQVRRTLTVGATPTGLAEGQLSVGMADNPPTLWAGVPTSVDPAGRVQLIPVSGSVDQTALATALADYLPLVGGTLTGLLALDATPPTGDSSLTAATTEFVQHAIAPFQQEISSNSFDNGAFQVWQRYPAPYTGHNQYGADRWLQNMAGGDTTSVISVALTDADRTALLASAATLGYQHQFAGTNTAASYTGFEQRLEITRWRFLAGKTLTVSFYAYGVAGTPSVGLSYDEYFGTGGTPAATTRTNIGVTPALTGAWTRYQFTFTAPSLAGRNLGTNNDGFARIVFYLSVSPLHATFAAPSGNIGVQSGTVRFWGLRLEIGEQATPFVVLADDIEYRNCQRFFAAISLNLIGYHVAGGTVGYAMGLPVRMRAFPTIVPAPNGYDGMNNITNPIQWFSNPTTASGTGTTVAVGGFFFIANLFVSADL